MKAKKLISMILVGATAMSLLVGCGSTKTQTQQSASAADTTEAAEDADSTESEEAEEDTGEAADTDAADETADETADTSEGKTLVVYYSASGNTARVAKAAADAAGADLFEIEPVEPYTDEDLNWTNDDSRVSREHNDESLRDVELVSTEVPDWDSYDTVLIGYPIWWGIAAWPTDGFVEANDFTGKTVIPFCTAASSGIGQSGELLAELAGTGDWQEGMRFRSGASDEDVAAWVESLGLAQE